MADIIQLLPDHVANQIAAGEVVQRPASVVKELMENAIDANATSIKLLVKDGGKALIQVIDNGKGMSGTDARLSFERHATSKITKAEDLFQLTTKGFRGEALASIAAIAHVEMKTKQDHEELGTAITIEGSKVISQDTVVTPTGTSIAVKHLFFNIPARRNFLKSRTVEMRHVNDEFQRVALAHPEISFVLHHNDSELFNLPASNYRQRIVNLLGAKTNEKLVPVEESTEVLAISGFAVKPEFAKKSRGEQFFFINQRYIRSPYLNHAVNAAFEGLLKEGTHPSFFLNLTVDPQTVDINIHPTKTEVKFEDEQTLYAILRAAVKHSLGQFSITPALDFEMSQSFDTPYNYKDKVVGSPKVEVDPSFNPFKDDYQSGSRTKITTSKAQSLKTQSTSWESLYIGLNDTNSLEQGTALEIESKASNETLFEDQSIEGHTKTYQFRKKYIITSVSEGLLVIDQNRAHQRIMYETFLKHITVQNGVSQQLLFPLQLNYSNTEISLLAEVQPDLEASGFVFTKYEGDNLEITGIPAAVLESEVSMILDQIIADLNNEIPEHSFSQADMLAKSMAKVLSIKSGKVLNSQEQEHLVNSLFACKETMLSPFNKPTFITLTHDELERKFM